MVNIFRGWDLIVSDIPEFISAFITVTLKVSIISSLLALVIGVVLGLLSTNHNKVIRFILRSFIEFFQNTPILIQVFFVYIGLPYAGIVLPTSLIAILVVSLYHSAFICEIVRSGIESINKGQYEAAASQGFGYVDTMRYIILPQTIKVILPPITTQIVNLIKNTSVLQIIAGGDLMYVTSCWATSTGFTFPPYIIAAALYFLVCYPLTCLSRYFEKRNEAGYHEKLPETSKAKGFLFHHKTVEIPAGLAHK